ncbi:hypothetical protein HKX54_16370 [Sulfitobacter sp. M57]|nr:MULTISPECIES: hypothetical protein [unclassified Sulfitobacter]MDF3423607.1 hypothetical protein [Sulfitobacter sp. KE43]MDF3475673.1 hypothetical protein [Sulfitobacter sp. M48]MDF3530284.1 hypothetical protein [Sulfitobacter sp. M77]MDF3416128.1 hypothetical protein [Sulfitobacter sp. KE5]MDF3434591.1 hypothetical protein [Sulfitobacter sp. KE42]
MTPDDPASTAEPDKTQPPLAALRYATPAELYAKMPHVSQLTLHRPTATERAIEYLYRLRASTTPEEAVTFTAFATMPKMGVWWGYECLRQSGDALSNADREMMELVANWTQYPDNENRYRAMKAALYAPVLTPATYLGLATGWSGGAIAPNDPAGVPAHRGPRALNTAVLSCLAQSNLQARSIRLARFIDQAEVLYHAT